MQNNQISIIVVVEGVVVSENGETNIVVAVVEDFLLEGDVDAVDGKFEAR